MANDKRKNDGPADKAYTAERRWERNKARNVAAEARRQAKDAALAPARTSKRKAGALRRIDRRIEAAQKAGATALLARLVGTRANVFAAANTCAEAA